MALRMCWSCLLVVVLLTLEERRQGANAATTAAPVCTASDGTHIAYGSSAKVSGCKTATCSTSGKLTATSNCLSYQECISNACKIKLIIKIKCRNAMKPRRQSKRQSIMAKQTKQECLNSPSFAAANPGRCTRVLFVQKCQSIGIRSTKSIYSF